MDVLGAIFILVFFGALLLFLEKREFIRNKAIDDSKDYFNQGVDLKKKDENGIDYLYTIVKSYQENKRKYIEEVFQPNKIIDWNGACWKVVSTFEKEEINKNNFIIKEYEYLYSVRVECIIKRESKDKNINNYGVITNINDSIVNNGNINISNDLDYEKLFYLIDEFLKLKNNDVDIVNLKRDLKLLKYEINDNEINKEELPNIIDKLKKFATTTVPFASLANQIIIFLQKFLM